MPYARAMDYRHFASDDEKTWSLKREYPVVRFVKHYGLTLMFGTGMVLLFVSLIRYL